MDPYGQNCEPTYPCVKLYCGDYFELIIDQLSESCPLSKPQQKYISVKYEAETI